MPVLSLSVVHTAQYSCIIYLQFSAGYFWHVFNAKTGNQVTGTAAKCWRPSTT